MPQPPFCCFTFQNVHFAMRFEQAMQIAGSKVNLIPVPRSISASCGLAAKFAPEILEQVRRLCRENSIEYEKVFLVDGEIVTELV
ncbi:MAG: DUF3343 domain-containing protein [Negativicutes bacterium]|nr:DUF3343 domain-containing protein [Negativicutes bacterium]